MRINIKTIFKVKKIYLFFLFLSFPLFINTIRSESLKDSKNILSQSYLDKKGSIDYIIGIGDILSISLIDSADLSQNNLMLSNFNDYVIEGDGTLFLPRFSKLYVEGLTLNELTLLLNDKYKEVFLNPDVKIKVKKYRSIQVFVDGEVENPGLYTFSGRGSSEFYEINPSNSDQMLGTYRSNQIIKPKINLSNSYTEPTGRFPDLYSVLKKAGGITAFSDLSNIQVIRENPLSKGGGKIKAEINFIDVIKLSDNSNNIRILDGDKIFIKRSPIELAKQLSRAVQTNLNSKFIDVVVSGRVENQGRLTVANNATLNDVLKMAGGTKILKGAIEFTRFKNNGEVDSRKFNYSPNATRGERNNPFMKSGDIVSVNKGAIIATKDVINEVTSPFIGIYSTYAVLDSILN